MASGNKAANGFAALKELDTNNDGKIDANDEAYTSLRLWQDANSNGVSEAGELYTLAELGVQSINTGYTNGTLTDSNGNKHLQLGNFTRADGSVAKVTDVWFTTDYARTQAMEQLAVSEDIAALPDIAGFGNVYSLHQAMVRDTTGQLQSILNNFINESEIQARHNLLDTLILKWTNSDQYSVSSRGSYIADGRKLYAIEEFLGEKFTQGSGTNPGPNASAVLMEAYRLLHNTLYSQLMLKTHFEPLMSKLSISLVDGEIKLDVSNVIEYLYEKYQQNPEKALNYILDFGKTFQYSGNIGNEITESLREYGDPLVNEFSLLIFTIGIGTNQQLGSNANDTIIGSSNDDFILGLNGNDVLEAGKGSNQLYGGLGDDTLRVDKDATNNLFSGGQGNDTLYGSRYSDTFLFNLGDGQDIIIQPTDSHQYTNTDVLRFGAGITATDFELQRHGNDLVIAHQNGLDQITLQGLFSQPDQTAQYYYAQMIDRFEFADGSSLTWENMISHGVYGRAADTGGTLVGWAGKDVLIGGVGNDSIYSGSGNDILDGGLGNDYLVGGSGNDTYLFGLGDGKDTVDNNDTLSSSIDKLVFGAGISTDELWFEQSGNDLQVSILDTTDSVLIKNWYSSSSYKLDLFETDDGDVLYSSNVQSLVNAQKALGSNSEQNTPTELIAQLGEISEEFWI